jgi:hypothetical protein
MDRKQMRNQGFTIWKCTAWLAGLKPRNVYELQIQFYFRCGFWEEPLPYVRFEVFIAMTMKNGIFWDVTPCGSCTNKRFGGT